MDAAVLLLQRLELRTGRRPLALVRDSAAAYDSLSLLTWMALQGIVSVVALSANDSPADKAFRNERRHLTAEDLRLQYATLRNMRALANANWEALVPLAALISATPCQLAAARYRAFRLPTNRRDEVSVDGSLLGVTEPAPGRVLVGIRTIEPLAVGRSCRAVAEALRVRIQLPELEGGLRTLGDGLEDVTVIGSAEGSYVRRLSGNRFVSGRGNRIVDEVPGDDLCDRILLHLGRHRVREKQKARRSLGQDDGGGGCGVTGRTVAERGEIGAPRSPRRQTLGALTAGPWARGAIRAKGSARTPRTRPRPRAKPTMRRIQLSGLSGCRGYSPALERGC